MPLSVFIDGGAGTTGLEIAQRLSERSEFNLISLDEDKRKNTAARREALNDADFAIICLPDDAVKNAVDMVSCASTAIIDASSLHRVHPSWTYGFPELGRGARAKIAGSKRVSNPGCYPTGFLALIAPLVTAKLIPDDWPYTVNAVSGYSGGGKAMIDRFANQGEIGFRAYGLDMAHKHLPEMQVHAGLALPPLFAPSVIRAFRGMLVEVPLPISVMPGSDSAEEMRDCLAAHYAGSQLVNVHLDIAPSELLIFEDQAPTDRLDLYLMASGDGRQIRLVAMLDNLGKGASGAAVQNLNIMAGLDEMAGLRI